ncbi:hypothetical protein BO70DRAFT_398887 [Aspergillus heteromorphus CBS 117.55]|uniref:Uncharacterized protein n=1 Tax=Aspergillus heteromorphus CBS 117.55 TaxID=1448321 RepID=A0A317VH28_9EURO|nr:uncharacterized protein BO70DRAFT_398887 [Aspergillus heteromorphus CBS 117.55]PWY73664.1 hypothetical protein BO70DRAFT_398887 [Aspergillus heteromorphus CBS 117.55]
MSSLDVTAEGLPPDWYLPAVIGRRPRDAPEGKSQPDARSEQRIDRLVIPDSSLLCVPVAPLDSSPCTPSRPPRVQSPQSTVHSSLSGLVLSSRLLPSPLPRLDLIYSAPPRLLSPPDLDRTTDHLHSTPNNSISSPTIHHHAPRPQQNTETVSLIEHTLNPPTVQRHNPAHTSIDTAQHMPYLHSTPSQPPPTTRNHHLISLLITMSTNRPFLTSILAAFRTQPILKAPTAGSQSASGGPSSTLSSTQIAQGARAIATKATNTGGSNSNGNSASNNNNGNTNNTDPPSSSTHHYHHHSTASRSHSHHRSSLSQPDPSSTTQQSTSSSSPIPAASTPIPINNSHGRRRRGSDSSSGSGGFCDALGHEKWYIGGRTPGAKNGFIVSGW